MKGFLRLADNKPFVFTLSTLISWVLLAGLINGFVILVLKIPTDDPIVLQTGNLVATCILLILTWRLGWFHKIGLTKSGSRFTWFITLLLAIYIITAGFFSFFKDVTFTFNSLYNTQEARDILLRDILVGFIEETVFRGVLLYSLVRVWGKKRSGLVASVIVQAALFGVFHSLQVLAGATTSAAMANVLDTFIFGVITGSVVLLGGTLWPAILLHFVSNAFILIKGLSSAWVYPYYSGYLWEALLESFLAVICLWIILKKQPVQQAP